MPSGRALQQQPQQQQPPPRGGGSLVGCVLAKAHPAGTTRPVAPCGGGLRPLPAGEAAAAAGPVGGAPAPALPRMRHPPSGSHPCHPPRLACPSAARQKQLLFPVKFVPIGLSLRLNLFVRTQPIALAIHSTNCWFPPDAVELAPLALSSLMYPCLTACSTSTPSPSPV